MESLYILVPLSVALVLVIGVVFWFALQGGQFDDLDGPAHAVLDNDEGFDPSQNARRDGQ